MKIRALLLAMSMATALTGCQNMDSNGLLSSGAEAFQAYSLSDTQVKALSDQACKDMDSKATIAPASSEYTTRLGKIAAALGDNINGQPVNYKVYMAKDVNAFAMANGCIRVYSGLMDMMTDLGEKLVNSQFSQRQESEADDYSYDLLRKRGINPAGLATSFEKLAKLEAGRQSSMFDDHPASAERAQHIRDRMSADGIK